MKLHLFYPENDLALASGKAGYTPPPKVMDLRRAGAVLPLWYGDPGDKVCTTGVSAAWFDSMAERFDLRTDVFDIYTTAACSRHHGDGRRLRPHCSGSREYLPKLCRVRSVWNRYAACRTAVLRR